MLNNFSIISMSDCSVSFPGPVSKSTICDLVIECLKHILYYRGQFPLPLDQLKRLIKTHEESIAVQKRVLTIDNYPVYYDEPCEQECQSPAIVSKSANGDERKKQKFIETITKFDEFFNQLTHILNRENVLEIVLNLGSNMMNPNELYRIMMPPQCSNPHCTEDNLSLQRCRMQFFRAIMGSTLWKDLSNDRPLPISVLLLLGPGVSLNEHMEQKRFYALPKCKHRTVRFCGSCVHSENDLVTLENFHEQSTSNSNASISRNLHSSGLWVKMRPDLKGFKEQLLSNNLL